MVQPQLTTNEQASATFRPLHKSGLRLMATRVEWPAITPVTRTKSESE